MRLQFQFSFCLISARSTIRGWNETELKWSKKPPKTKVKLEIAGCLIWLFGLIHCRFKQTEMKLNCNKSINESKPAIEQQFKIPFACLPPFKLFKSANFKSFHCRNLSLKWRFICWFVFISIPLHNPWIEIKSTN